MFRSSASSIVLAAGIVLALSPSVLGQSIMIGDIEITAAQMPEVEMHCAALLSSDGASEAPIADGDGRENQSSNETAETDEAAGGDTTEEHSGVESPGVLASTDVNLDEITLKDCEAAGIEVP